jgi:polysaccharide export outer membrane protein
MGAEQQQATAAGARGARHRRRSAMVVSAAIGIAASVFGPGCATDRPFVWVQDTPLLDDGGQPIIGPRDTIAVDVRDQASLSGEFLVGDGGDYRQPGLGPIHVEGRTPAAVVIELEERLKLLLVKPQVTVSLVRMGPVRVNVVGEVRTPGSYELLRGRGVLPALAAAGWLTEFANRDRIFVLRPGQQETRIRFRARELTVAEPHAARFRLRDGDVVVVE